MANQPVTIYCDTCGKSIDLDDEQEIPDWQHPNPDSPYEQIILCQACLYGPPAPVKTCPDCGHPAKLHVDSGCTHEPFCGCMTSGESLRFGKDR